MSKHRVTTTTKHCNLLLKTNITYLECLLTESDKKGRPGPGVAGVRREQPAPPGHRHATSPQMRRAPSRPPEAKPRCGELIGHMCKEIQHETADNKLASSDSHPHVFCMQLWVLLMWDTHTPTEVGPRKLPMQSHAHTPTSRLSVEQVMQCSYLQNSLQHMQTGAHRRRWGATCRTQHDGTMHRTRSRNRAEKLAKQLTAHARIGAAGFVLRR